MRRMLTENDRAEFVDTNEAAALVGLKVSSFKVYVANGHGPPRALKHRGRVYYRRTDVEAWRRARSVPPKAAEAGRDDGLDGGSVAYLPVRREG